MKTSVHFLITLLLAAMASVQSAHAATITVQSTGDGVANAGNCPGAGCRLRDALAAATDNDTINFAVTTPATITLNSGQLFVDVVVTISGPGANLLTVDANHASRVFVIAPIQEGFSISGLTIANGSANDGSGGAGILSGGGGLTISNCTLSGNSAPNGSGGGIAAFGIFTIISNCTLSGNSVGGGASGGGVLTGGTATISNSTLSGNSAPNGAGGGIINEGALTVTNCTLSGNTATFGGGIVNGDGTLIISNSTLTGNSADAGASIYNDTVTVEIGGTILQTGVSVGNIHTNTGTVTSDGYNLSSDDASAYLNQPTDQNSKDPMLGPLQDNGGPTFTHALLPGSPAIDKGKNFSGSTTDQRGTGFARTVDNPSIANATGGDGTDIGAFEVQAAAYAAQIQQPINADGSSVFNVKRGVVPVKFTLTLNGTPTCALPPATIAVYRTGTGGNQSIDESIYTAPADNGSNFRIDSCQYVYNLSASPLGVGTYEVDILINNQVVGRATFKLK